MTDAKPAKMLTLVNKWWISAIRPRIG